MEGGVAASRRPRRLHPSRCSAPRGPPNRSRPHQSPRSADVDVRGPPCGRFNPDEPARHARRRSTRGARRRSRRLGPQPAAERYTEAPPNRLLQVRRPDLARGRACTSTAPNLERVQWTGCSVTEPASRRVRGSTTQIARDRVRSARHRARSPTSPSAYSWLPCLGLRSERGPRTRATRSSRAAQIAAATEAPSMRGGGRADAPRGCSSARAPCTSARAVRGRHGRRDRAGASGSPRRSPSSAWRCPRGQPLSVRGGGASTRSTTSTTTILVLGSTALRHKPSGPGPADARTCRAALVPSAERSEQRPAWPRPTRARRAPSPPRRPAERSTSRRGYNHLALDEHRRRAGSLSHLASSTASGPAPPRPAPRPRESSPHRARMLDAMGATSLAQRSSAELRLRASTARRAWPESRGRAHVRLIISGTARGPMRDERGESPPSLCHHPNTVAYHLKTCSGSSTTSRASLAAAPRRAAGLPACSYRAAELDRRSSTASWRTCAPAQSGVRVLRASRHRQDRAAAAYAMELARASSPWRGRSG